MGGKKCESLNFFPFGASHDSVTQALYNEETEKIVMLPKYTPLEMKEFSNELNKRTLFYFS